MHDQRVQTRRFRLIVGAAFVLAVGLTVFVTIGHHLSTSSSGTPATTHASTSSTSPTTVPPSPPFAVGTETLSFTEPVAGGGAPRVIPATVRYPTTGAAGADGRPNATPLRSAGPLPLVVFSQGFDIEAEAYAALLDFWAAAGYVVVDPTYPATAPSAPGGVDENDIVNHPADLRFVITSMLQASNTPGTTLTGLLDPSEIAVIGHSDGGDVSLATAANTCCLDARVKAAIILSGAELTSFGGTYFATPALPMLVVQGTADVVNPPACSIQLYNQAPQPKYFLSLEGQNHESPYLMAGAPLETVKEVTTGFLNGYLRHSASSLAALESQGSVPGLATISSAPAVGPEGGSCPGAPGA